MLIRTSVKPRLKVGYATFQGCFSQMFLWGSALMNFRLLHKRSSLIHKFLFRSHKPKRREDAHQGKNFNLIKNSSAWNSLNTIRYVQKVLVHSVNIHGNSITLMRFSDFGQIQKQSYLDSIYNYEEKFCSKLGFC